MTEMISKRSIILTAIDRRTGAAAGGVLGELAGIGGRAGISSGSTRSRWKHVLAGHSLRVDGTDAVAEDSGDARVAARILALWSLLRDVERRRRPLYTGAPRLARSRRRWEHMVSQILHGKDERSA